MATVVHALAPLYTWDRASPAQPHWVPPFIEGTMKIAFGRLILDGTSYQGVGSPPTTNYNILDAKRIGINKVVNVYSLTPFQFLKAPGPDEPAYLLFDHESISFRLFRFWASNNEVLGHTIAGDGSNTGVIFDLIVFGY